ncbi:MULTISPECIES: hypothetical protein [unclassified Colwellia]|uniref:hypothetical protein n=1 Tax=unclassified Colwellia TaxID=196834 RepID=UPI0015F55112|nr:MULTISPECIES: hypothetical protein [unclassified Colwellia]MBA6254420.1 hypothetical protein [Colwellia sp. MB3u-28]MBA6258503.1 hypothetical protein [Colwellia sp. MB3u-41]
MKLSSHLKRNVAATLVSPVSLIPVVSLGGILIGLASEIPNFGFEDVKLAVAFSLLTLAYAYPVTIVFGAPVSVFLQKLGIFKLHFLIPISLIPTLFFHLKFGLDLKWFSIFTVCSISVSLTYWLVFRWLK